MIRFIKVRCKSCTSLSCDIRPLGSWCTDTEGCIKEVNALDGNKFFYYVVEVKPMFQYKESNKHYPNIELWNEMDDFIFDIHNRPHGERYKY